MSKFLYSQCHMSSMRATPVARQMFLHSSSVHTLLRKWGVTEVASVIIEDTSSGKVVANGTMYTASLVYPTKRNLGELGPVNETAKWYARSFQSICLGTDDLGSPSPFHHA